MPHPYSCIQPRDDNFGIGLFSKLPLAKADIVCIGEAGVPSVLAEISTSDGPVAVIATHPLPPAGPIYSKWRNDQLERIPDFMPAAIPVLVLGDLNATPWNHYFQRLLKRTGLKDSSRGYGVQTTWPDFNPLLRIPIDHCLHSPEICVTGRTIGPAGGSDHYPVIVDFAMARPNARHP